MHNRSAIESFKSACDHRVCDYRTSTSHCEECLRALHIESRVDRRSWIGVLDCVIYKLDERGKDQLAVRKHRRLFPADGDTKAAPVCFRFELLDGGADDMGQQ